MEDKTLVPARYLGQNGAIFGLAFKTGLLTLLTAGIYRFWAKTRIRKYVWSSVSVDGDRMEYTGTGLEKFLGFLMAVVVLAVYLGLVQMILFAFGLQFVLEPQTQAEVIMQLSVFYITFLAVLPLILFAQYRARRYMMARTRFRGIRFGMESAAWGYVWRAILHYLLTALTLGLMLPRQVYYLEKYKTDRSHYGDARFEQGGSWTGLYPAMKHIFIGVGIVVLGAVLIAAMGSPLLGGTLIFVGYFWIIFGFVAFRVRAFAYLTGAKSLAGGVTFAATPSAGSVIGIVILGGLVVGLAAAVTLGVVGAIAGGAFAASIQSGIGMNMTQVLIFAALYLLSLVFIGAVVLAQITQPIIAHYTNSIEVRNAGALAAIRQRAHDSGADAEGFADALDIGAAI